MPDLMFHSDIIPVQCYWASRRIWFWLNFFKFLNEIFLQWPCTSRQTWRCGGTSPQCRLAAQSPWDPRWTPARPSRSQASWGAAPGLAWRRGPGRSLLTPDQRISKLEFRINRIKSQFWNPKLNLEKLVITCSGFTNVSALILPKINLSILIS